jgi:DNA-damage-inducible protein D
MDTNTPDLFHFQNDTPNFEALALENGFTYWLKSSLANSLGYADGKSIEKAMNKAMTVCLTLNIPVFENFVQIESASEKNDFKLSRFACYLTVMNGDVRNPLVAHAQAYFAGLADAFAAHTKADSVERVLIRGEISEREGTLSSTAKTHGVENYAFFQNAGYRGLYNMNLTRLKNHKGLGDKTKGSLLDFMGKDELAANLFRITQTEAKIRNESIRGQNNLERTAEGVGRDVRNTMIKISGQKPEELKLEINSITDVKKGIKLTHKELKKIDQKPTGKKK